MKTKIGTSSAFVPIGDDTWDSCKVGPAVNAPADCPSIVCDSVKPTKSANAVEEFALTAAEMTPSDN